MNIRESIANLRTGEALAVECRHQADYVLALAKETGHILRRQAEEGGVVTLHCVGVAQGSALAWLKRHRTQRKAKQRWREKNPDKHRQIEEHYAYHRKLREAGICGNLFR
jgi:DNA-binding IclR family transcriptional regulator